MAQFGMKEQLFHNFITNENICGHVLISVFVAAYSFRNRGFILRSKIGKIFI
jgi:hypothetical protein